MIARTINVAAFLSWVGFLAFTPKTMVDEKR